MLGIPEDDIDCMDIPIECAVIVIFHASTDASSALLATAFEERTKDGGEQGKP